MIAAGKEDLRQWFVEGVEKGAEYMLIVYDRMDYPDKPDSPYYAESEDRARSILREFNSDPMSEVMEIYDLKADMEAQLAERRAWHLPKVPTKTRLSFIEKQNDFYIKKYFKSEGYFDVITYDLPLYTDNTRKTLSPIGICFFTSQGDWVKTGAAVYQLDENGRTRSHYIRLYHEEGYTFSLTLFDAET